MVGVVVGVFVGVTIGVSVLVGVVVGGVGQKDQTPTSPPNTRNRADKRTIIALDRSGVTEAAEPVGEGVSGG